MTRFVPVTVLVLLAAGRVATAQTSGMLPNGATIIFDKRQILDESKNDGTFIEPQSGTPELQHYFNLAHCNCAKANVGKLNAPGTFNYLIQEPTPSLLANVPGVFYAGTNCDDAAHREGGSAPSCKKLSNVVGDIDVDLYPSGSYQNFNLYEVAIANSPTSPTTADCPQFDSINNSIYVLVDTKGGSNYDFASWQPAGTKTGDTTTGSGIDTKPPPLPTGIRAEGGDAGIHISWTPPASSNTDVQYYQALCATMDDAPARSKSHDAQYVTSASLNCNATGDPPLDASDIATSETETPVNAPTGDFGSLDASYICGQSSSGTATSLEITGLSNGTPYKVILLSVDLHGNFKGTYFTTTVTPTPSTDFWEDIHDRGGQVEGGLCLLAETYGDDSALTGALRAFRDDTLGRTRIGRWLADGYYATIGKLGVRVHRSLALRIAAGLALAPLVALALAWHWLTLPGLLALLGLAWLWRRRRLPRWLARVIPVAAALTIVLVSGRASAGGGYQPYWENSNIKDDEKSFADEPGLVTWHVGIRIGPYVPDIDKQFSGTTGPYKQMFGGYRILPMLDVDRILWSRLGQVGVGFSIGYLQKTARTFTDDSKPEDDPRARAADENKFRLVPMALTATYRFTWFDDEYGVPVVPYVRGGLSYYLWWVSVNGGTASACTAATAMEAMCTRTKALGASFGFQGSIGLAIRAERIDAPTAMSMQQSGIQHAGVYAELSLAKVDGFGSDTRLSVGDRTWFAGVNFEF